MLHAIANAASRIPAPRPARDLLLLLLGLAAGCAPLQRPEPPAAAPADSSAAALTDSVSAVVRHLEQKRAEPASEPYIAVMPLADLSGFRSDIWDLELEMARLLSNGMRGLPYWQVVDQEAVAAVVGNYRKLTRKEVLEAGAILEADLVVTGSIVDSDMKRISVGDPFVGGYKSYTGIAELQVLVLQVADGSELGRADSKQEAVSRGLGLDLLGKPRDEDLELMGLEETEFGSTEFQATPLGQVTYDAVEDLVGKLTRLLHPSSLKLDGQPGRIMSKHQEEVYINLGSENGLRAGYRFEVYPGPERARAAEQGAPERIGLVEVADVIGGRLSRVRVVEGYYAIEVDDRLELMEIGEPHDGGP